MNMTQPLDPQTRVVVHVAELGETRQVGGHLRAYCPVHGGDRQRSLSVNPENGYGQCFACGAQTFTPEYADPDALARQEWRQEYADRRASRRPRVRTAAELTRPPQGGKAEAASASKSTAKPADPAEWQREELLALQRLEERMRKRLHDDRAQTYLAERGIPLEFAERAGMGYIPADARLGQTGLSAKWRDRLIFPLGSPAGVGYIGRALHLWQPGMDEDTHKALLEADDRDSRDLRDWGRRWEKTYPAGWHGYAAMPAARYVVIVEGSMDALALRVAGMSSAQTAVVALAGIAARVDWIPPSVRGVVVALDGDARGQEAAARLCHELQEAGIRMALCVPPMDAPHCKDWSACWKHLQWDGVMPVFEALDTLE